MTLLDVRAPAGRAEIGDWPDLSDPATRSELTADAVKALPRLLARMAQESAGGSRRGPAHPGLATAGDLHRAARPAPG